MALTASQMEILRRGISDHVAAHPNAGEQDCFTAVCGDAAPEFAAFVQLRNALRQQGAHEVLQRLMTTVGGLDEAVSPSEAYRRCYPDAVQAADFREVWVSVTRDGMTPERMDELASRPPREKQGRTPGDEPQNQ